MRQRRLIIIFLCLIVLTILVFILLYKPDIGNKSSTPKPEDIKAVSKVLIENTISNALFYYDSISADNFSDDDYLLLKEIARMDKRFEPNLKRLYNIEFSNKPFYRLIDKNISSTPNDEFWESTGEYNLLRALYCDKVDYSEKDFKKLTDMYRGDGMYLDAHMFLALILLEKNNCYDLQKVKMLKEKTAQELINIQDQDKAFRDIYVERITFLCWAGFKNDIKEEWISKINTSLKKDYAWGYFDTNISNPHTSGLALLSLFCYLDYEVENFY